MKKTAYRLRTDYFYNLRCNRPCMFISDCKIYSLPFGFGYAFMA